MTDPGPHAELWKSELTDAKLETQKYINQLDRIAKTLTKMHPLGKVKAIGRMECAAALADLVRELAEAKARTAELESMIPKPVERVEPKVYRGASGHSQSLESKDQGRDDLWHDIRTLLHGESDHEADEIRQLIRDKKRGAS